MMRSETDIKNLVVNFAEEDERIRAVVLNGSRANPDMEPDKFQDFDVVFIVTDFESFISDHDWINVFGEKMIWQLPDEMNFGEATENDNKNISFGYLMIFKDGNRIDLTIFPAAHFAKSFKIDSLTVVWLDKDKLFPDAIVSNDSDCHVKQPNEKDYFDTCNEFWWVSTYVGKGLLRNEITYAKEMLDTVVRPMFMKMMAWKIGIENNFSVSTGKAGKLMPLYLSEDDYTRLLKTYSDADIENNWKALFIMTELFRDASTRISH